LFNSSIAARFQLFEAFPGEDVTDDQALSDMMALGGQAILHKSGTTRFTPTCNLTEGVVDMDFKVCGIDSLMLGSLSVFPFFTSAGGQSVATIIGWNLQNSIRKSVGLPTLN
jgi:choline dehydrogenase-like flavoprotein